MTARCGVQFNTKYLHYDGTWRHRVTTISRRWAAAASVHDLSHGFDQEAAAALLARYVTWKMETEEDFSATRWIDRSLIRLCQRCGPLPQPRRHSQATAAPPLCPWLSVISITAPHRACRVRCGVMRYLLPTRPLAPSSDGQSPPRRRAAGLTAQPAQPPTTPHIRNSS